METEIFNKQGVLRIKLLNEDYETLKKAESILENLSEQITQGGGSIAMLNTSMTSTSLRQVLEDLEKYKIDER